MAISGFTPSVGITYVFEFNINCTVGTATISVEQDNIMVSPALYPLTTGFNRVVGSFTYNGTPNTVVFKIYTGVASWNAQWDSFTLSTYSIGMNANMNALTVNNRFTQRYNALPTDVSTLVNRATMDAANLLPLNNVWTGSNTFNNSLQVAGGNMTCSLGVIAKQTATAGSLVQLAGGGAGNSPYLEFLFGGNSRGYIGNASAVDLDLVAQNGAKLNFYTAGTKRMEIDTGGDASFTGNVKVGVAKRLILDGTGATEIYNGQIDAYNPTGNNNLMIRSWWGIGFPSYDNIVRIGMDTRTGNAGFSGTITAKNMTIANGDNSMTNYGPNSTWNAYLVVGSGTDKAGPAKAQVITTNGNLHLDAGNNDAMFYGYYANSRGTPNSHLFYGSNIQFASGIPQNTDYYSQVLVLNGTTLQKSQCAMREVYFSNNVAWGGGVNITYAFYRYNTIMPVQIYGKCSGYYSGAGMMQTTIRLYSQVQGTYYYYPLNSFVNVGYNHFTVPLNVMSNGLPTGWFDIYVYSTSGWITDGNDQLTICVQMLPVRDW